MSTERTAGRPRLRTASLALGMSALLLGVAALAEVRTVAAADLAGSTTDLQASATQVQAHHPLTLTATVVAGAIPLPSPDPSASPNPSPGPNPTPTGTVTFEDHLGVAVTTHDVPLGATGVAVLTLDTLPVGEHVFRAVYGGDTVVAGSTSPDVDVTVATDVVEATGVGLSASSVFPAHDGYKDTVSAKGFRNEPISVGIVVRNSSGKVVRKASIGLGTGAYAWPWNGRNTSSKIVPAGRYSITQTLRDTAGTTLVVKSSVTVSLKKLAWKSFTQTKAWSQRSWRPVSAIAGWQFRVASAVKYGSMTVKVYGWGTDTYILARIGACPGSAWDGSCYDIVKQMGAATRWYTKSLSGSNYVGSGHMVRVVIVTLARAQVKQVGVVLRYAVLR